MKDHPTDHKDIREPIAHLRKHKRLDMFECHAEPLEALLKENESLKERMAQDDSIAASAIEFYQNEAAALEKQLAETRAALEKCFAVLITQDFEQDHGKPPMLKDGIKDRAISAAREVLNRKEGE